MIAWSGHDAEGVHFVNGSSAADDYGYARPVAKSRLRSADHALYIGLSYGGGAAAHGLNSP